MHLPLLCEDKVRSFLIGDAQTLIESAERSLYLHSFKGRSGTCLQRYRPVIAASVTKSESQELSSQIRMIQNAIEKAMI